MTKASPAKPVTRKLRCAIYTRKSSEEGLEQEFNSLDAQRDAGLAYIESQRHEGWIAIADRYEDGGFSGGNLERPALKRLLADIEGGRVDVVVVYKIDRLSRALMDFAKLVEVFDRRGVTFVTGHTAKSGDEPNWHALAHSGTTLVIYMGLNNLASIVAGLRGAGMRASMPVAVVQNGTR